MKRFRVNVSREEYGFILIEAETEDEAREKVECGDWEDEDFYIKNGGVVVDGVLEIT